MSPAFAEMLLSGFSVREFANWHSRAQGEADATAASASSATNVDVADALGSTAPGTGVEDIAKQTGKVAGKVRARWSYRAYRMRVPSTDVLPCQAQRLRSRPNHGTGMAVANAALLTLRIGAQLLFRYHSYVAAMWYPLGPTACMGSYTCHVY